MYSYIQIKRDNPCKNMFEVNTLYDYRCSGFYLS